MIDSYFKGLAHQLNRTDKNWAVNIYYFVNVFTFPSDSNSAVNPCVWKTFRFHVISRQFDATLPACQFWRFLN